MHNVRSNKTNKKKTKRESDEKKEEIDEKCIVCGKETLLKITATDRMFDCYHRYCMVCFELWVIKCINHNLIPKCMHENCKQFINLKVSTNNLRYFDRQILFLCL